eukprot:12925151-Prorocentrum_lima.AAC.1
MFCLGFRNPCGVLGSQHKFTNGTALSSQTILSTLPAPQVVVSRSRMRTSAHVPFDHRILTLFQILR